jgi:hypothetical protein
MKYAKGVCWVDDTRIPFIDESDVPNDMDKTHLDGRNFYTQVYNGFMYQQNKEGRYTPSLLVCDDMLNDGSVSKSQKTNGVNVGRFPNTIKTGVEYQKEYERGFTDKGTNSRYYDLDKWFDKVINNL